ncbi:uncharacterized protein zgc:113423 isoform X1 [Megalops cyprinoides]|uniref:uncharacterized protein zgc:113423 isoform X1 n=1 Tax=Megalops cyprinoides TaxID=118141 RepID=UPI001864EF80|nr:uncharacterized protein zgc:113423 isoform X1 [Megalops cyprinoides]
MSTNDPVPVRIKVEEDYDQILVEDQQSRIVTEEPCDIASGRDPFCRTDVPKPLNMQMTYDGLCDSVEPVSKPEGRHSMPEMEGRGYSPRRWRGSGSLSGSVVSEMEEEPQMEDVSGAEMEYDCLPQYEQAGAEELYSIDHQRTLGEILTYCQVMYEAIQKLDQKFDQLQAKVTNVQAVHLSPALFPQKAQLLNTGGMQHGSSVSDSGLPMPQLVRVCSPPPPLQGEGKKPPPLSPAPGVPSPPQLAPQGQPSQLAQSIVRAHLTTQPLPPGKATTETLKRSAPSAGGSVAKTARKSLLTTSPSSHKTVPLEWLGDPKRKVKIPSSALQKAVALKSPRSVVRSLLRSVFPLETLTSSNIMGDSVRGLKKLDPNKIAAMREWLAKTFPTFDLKENGKDWKTCVSIINSTARYLRFEAKKHKKGQNENGKEPAPDEDSDPDPAAASATAEIDVELSDSEGDVPSTSRRTKTTTSSISKQEAAENSSGPIEESEEANKDDVYEYLGPPSRQVKVPRYAMFTARLRARPELVARYLIKYLFPEHVLVKSNVYGNREHGIQALDQNKISALREHLKERFPWLLLEESGQDWKACVGAINSTIRKFRHELKKGKSRKKRR